GEHAVVGGDGDVRGQRIPEAAAHHPAVYRGDHRLGQVPEVHELGHRVAVARPPALDVLADLDAGGIERGASVRAARDVEAGREATARASQDDRASLGVGVGLVE